MLSLFKYQRHKWFWKARHRITQISFYIGRLLLKLKEKLQIEKENFSFAWVLIRAVSPSLLFSLLLVISLEIFENLLLRYVFISKPLFVKHILDSLIFLHTQLVVSIGFLDTLLTIIASISAIFLGLYFTAVSVVASSAFAKTHSNLRELFLGEKVGNLYIKFVAKLASIAIILLGYRAFGGYPGVFIFGFVILGGAFAIFSFIVLGTRVLTFFDPTGLIMYELFKNLYRDTRSSTINGYRWSDSTFQSHYHRRAKTNISSLKALINLCIDNPQLYKRNFPFIVQNALDFLGKYIEQRSSIPTNSRWYPLIPKYKSWFFHSSSTLAISLQTQTYPHPDMAPNAYWIEEEITEFLSVSFQKMLKKNNPEMFSHTLEAQSTYFEILGSNLEIKKGMEIIRRFEQSVKNYLNLDAPAKGNYKDIELAMFEGYASTPISLSLGFYKLIRNLNKQEMLKKMDSVNWFHGKSIYDGRFPPLLLSRIEFLRKSLEFEKKIERRAISPNWYLRQLIVQRYLQCFQETINELISSLENFFVSKSEDLLAKELFILTSIISQKGLEMSTKMAAHLPKLQSLVRQLDTFAINKEIPWPEWNWDDIEKQIDKLYDKLVENMAKCIPGLSLVEHEEDSPHFFGLAYYTTCKECYDSIASKNIKKFKTIFPPLFCGSISAHSQLKEKTEKWDPKAAITISIAPLLDIMELSGYAKIYAELFDLPELWDECKRSWDGFLALQKPPGDTLNYLVSVCDYHESSFSVPHRAEFRANWQIQLNNVLREMDLLADYHYPRIGDKKDKHKSPVIRALPKGIHGTHISGAQVFVVTYVRKHPDAEGTEFKDIWGFADRMDREESANNT